MGRQVKISQPEFHKGLSELGVGTRDFQEIVQRSNGFDDGAHRLAELKKKVRANFRRKALELHPDQNGGDQEKTELFMLVQKTMQVVDGLEIRRPRPRPQHVFAPNGWGGYAATSSTTATGTGWPTVDVRWR